MSSPLKAPPRTSPVVWFGTFREPSISPADEARAYLLALEAAGYAPIAREPYAMVADAGLSGRHRSVVDRATSRRIPDDGFVAVQPHRQSRKP